MTAAERTEQDMRQKFFKPNEQVSIKFDDWTKIKQGFSKEFLFSLPDIGEFGFGGERSDIETQNYCDQAFQGMVERQDDSIIIKFNEQLDGPERYYSQFFVENGLDIEKI
ncbi:hypothetical protein GYA54_04365 [Candidatus Kuenenbacteria bacterium]|nr:hypothetical protein [Candidatus Kuenenbacteria bacterium]